MEALCRSSGPGSSSRWRWAGSRATSNRGSWAPGSMVRSRCCCRVLRTTPRRKCGLTRCCRKLRWNSRQTLPFPSFLCRALMSRIRSAHTAQQQGVSCCSHGIACSCGRLSRTSWSSTTPAGLPIATAQLACSSSTSADSALVLPLGTAHRQAITSHVLRRAGHVAAQTTRRRLTSGDCPGRHRRRAGARRLAALREAQVPRLASGSSELSAVAVKKTPSGSEGARCSLRSQPASAQNLGLQRALWARTPPLAKGAPPNGGE